MNFHLIQPMGGGGTRFCGTQIMPKPLISLQDKPFFYWSTISLSRCENLSDITYVILQEHAEKFGLDKEIKKYFPKANIKYLEKMLNGAVLTSIEGVQDIHDDLPIIFNDCDHAFVCHEFVEFLKNNGEADGGLMTFKSNEPKFSYVRYDENNNIVGTIEKQVASNDAICGAYYFKNKNVFLKYASRYLKNCNYNEFFMSGVYNEMCKDNLKIVKFETDMLLSFGTPDEYMEIKDSPDFKVLEFGSPNETKRAVREINKDAEVLKDVSSGSDAYTFFQKKTDKFFYRKIALAETGGVEKLTAQLKFILKYGADLRMPAIGKYEYNENLCYYDMEVNEKHENFFGFVKHNSWKKSWQILEGILNLLKNFHEKNKRDFDQAQLEKYVQSKIFGNVAGIMENGGEYISALQKYDTIFVNGEECKNLNYYFGSTGIFKPEHFLELFANDKCAVIHGDFTIDNIIYDEKNVDKAYLIDPNIFNLHETAFLDYAKMLQSIHGNYEFYKGAKGLKIVGNKVDYCLGDTQNYEKLYEVYDEYLRKYFSSKEYQSIYAHEIVHWIRLMPYKIRKDEKTAVLYYAQLLKILKDYCQKFRKDK